MAACISTGLGRRTSWEELHGHVHAVARTPGLKVFCQLQPPCDPSQEGYPCFALHAAHWMLKVGLEVSAERWLQHCICSILGNANAPIYWFQLCLRKVRRPSKSWLVDLAQSLQLPCWPISHAVAASISCRNSEKRRDKCHMILVLLSWCQSADSSGEAKIVIAFTSHKRTKNQRIHICCHKLTYMVNT
jgi:hypothetical protein